MRAPEWYMFLTSDLSILSDLEAKRQRRHALETGFLWTMLISRDIIARYRCVVESGPSPVNLTPTRPLKVCTDYATSCDYAHLPFHRTDCSFFGSPKQNRYRSTVTSFHSPHRRDLHINYPVDELSAPGKPWKLSTKSSGEKTSTDS